MRFLLALLVACSAQPRTGASTLASDTTFDVLSYDINAHFDWTQRRLFATTTIEVEFPDGIPPSVTLDSTIEHVTSVRAADGSLLLFSTTDTALTITTAGLQTPAKFVINYDTRASDYPDSGARLVSGLRAIPVRNDDPVKVPVVYTESEPRAARSWMPCHDTPSDRARFAMTFTMPTYEMLVANGTLTDDHADATTRTMRYETAYTLPTYLMAFAVGNFEVLSADKDGLPVSIVHRRGLINDDAAVLDSLVTLIRKEEALLGAFPFEKYMLVELPEGNGIENASISFQEETSTTNTFSSLTALTAHELAHQWFGDNVTMHTYDDVWIKEGVATLFEYEMSRDREDVSQDSLGGKYFGVAPGLKIYDPSVQPENKYGSGSYGRSAWWMTQVRSLLGEDAFWGNMREVLRTHRMGSITTDEFVAQLTTGLSDDVVAKTRQALLAAATPTITIADGPVLTLLDPESSMFAPFVLQWRDGTGVTREQTLEPGVPATLTAQSDDEYLVLDSHAVHLGMFSRMDDRPLAQKILIPLLTPRSAGAIADFQTLPGPAQRELLAVGMPPIGPEDLAAFRAGLASSTARGESIFKACQAAQAIQNQPELTQAWNTAIAAELLSIPADPSNEQLLNYFPCSRVTQGLFADEILLLGTTQLPFARQRFLSHVWLRIDLAIPAWKNAFDTGYNLAVRAMAADSLTAIARNSLPATFAPFAASLRTFAATRIDSAEASHTLSSLVVLAGLLASTEQADNQQLLDALDRLQQRAPDTAYVAGCAAANLCLAETECLSRFPVPADKADCGTFMQHI